MTPPPSYDEGTFPASLGRKRGFMSAASTVSVGRDVRVIGLIGVAHGSSHYYQLAFVTMLLIVRDRVGLSFEQVGFLGALFYAVSGFGQTAAGFAVDRFGARPILAGGLRRSGSRWGCSRSRIPSRALRPSPCWAASATRCSIPPISRCSTPRSTRSGWAAPSASTASAARSAGRQGRRCIPRRRGRLGRRGADRRGARPRAVGAGVGASHRSGRSSREGAG